MNCLFWSLIYFGPRDWSPLHSKRDSWSQWWAVLAGTLCWAEMKTVNSELVTEQVLEWVPFMLFVAVNLVWMLRLGFWMTNTQRPRSRAAPTLDTSTVLSHCVNLGSHMHKPNVHVRRHVRGGKSFLSRAIMGLLVFPSVSILVYFFRCSAAVIYSFCPFSPASLFLTWLLVIWNI